MRPTHAIMFLVFVCWVSGRAHANETWEDPPPWLGTWHANPEVSRILGFTQESPVEREKLQIEFFASRDDAIAAAGREIIQRVEAMFSERMGGRHRIIAAGRWNEERFTVDSLFFVTQIQGARFLWFGDPSVALNGGEVSFVRGVDPGHDLLVLDSHMPSFIKRRLRRTEQTASFFKAVGYQLKKTEVEK
ncbi:hypothetical protein [Crateriforma conspicua]|uniref:Uncharacterized protein n=1 Tax=Crateriforma conspicua TaxID=2527996 RepID=A0A5C5Y1C2_9PLAN|nr:hypothetical protein [Crateriforma conspicua]TWT68619.1 hypothetical protein Pan14r_08660 [Crateriforma conspicua]